MTAETLHEALASLGLASEPSRIAGKRRIFDAVLRGQVLGDFDAAEAWTLVRARRERAAELAASKRVAA